MLFRNKALTAVIVVLLAATGYTQGAQPGSLNTASGVVGFPHIGQITGDNVYVRSGAGISYYFCSKLGEGDTVTVVAYSPRWARILPPAGSFSWIYKSYIKLDKANPGLGQVTVDNVRVWAGSERIPPDDSTSLQAKLNEGDLVRLVEPQPQDSDYYKIVPPAGARLYVSRDYVKYTGPMPIKPLPQIPPRPDTASKPQPVPVGPPVTTVPKIGPVPKKVATETPDTTATKPQTPVFHAPAVATGPKPQTQSTPPVATGPEPPKTQPIPIPAGPFSEKELIGQCTGISEQIRAELTKQLSQQDYTQFKKKLTVILLDPNVGNARIYAEYYLDRLEGYELVRKASQLLARQQSKLEDIRAEIRQDYQQKLTAVSRAGKYIITGKIYPSQVYTQTGRKRYIIKNMAGRIVAYAVPSGKLAGVGLANLINKNVGLVGKIISAPANSVTLIEFTQVELLPDKSATITGS